MLLKQCIVNYQLMVNCRDPLCGHVRIFGFPRGRGVAHVDDGGNKRSVKSINTVDNISSVRSTPKVRNALNVPNLTNLSNLSNTRDFLFLHKIPYRVSTHHVQKNQRSNAPKISQMSSPEWIMRMARKCSGWRLRLFSSESHNGGKTTWGGENEANVENDQGKEEPKRNLSKTQQTFFNIRKSLKDSFEKHLKTHADGGVSIKDIYKILKKERNYLAVAFFCLLISSVGQMFFPMCISKIINMYGGKEESLKYVMDEVYKTIFLIIGISTFSFFRIYFIETSVEKITRRLRKDLFENILNQKLSFFEKQKTGELINRLSNDIEVSSRVLITLSFGIRNLIAAIVGGIFALHISPTKLFQSFLLPVSTSLLIGTTYGKIVKQISICKQEKLSNCIDFASEKIHNIANVRLLNGESFEKKEFTNYLNEVYKSGTKYSLVKAGNHFLFISIISLFVLHLIYYGNYLIANKYINTGDLFSLIMYSLLCGSGIQGVMQSIGDLQKCIGSCSKVLQIINLPKSEFKEHWSKDTILFLKNEDYSIKFDNVSFSYGADEEILPHGKSGASRDSVSRIPSAGSNRSSGTNGSTHTSRSSDTRGSTGTSATDSTSTTTGANRTYRGGNQSMDEKNYVLKKVSFFLPHNKSVAIVGKSGSGKTTILNLLSKRHIPNSGNILIGNFEIQKINSSALRYIQGVITQNPFLFNTSVKDNLLYPLKAYEQMLNEQLVLLEEEKLSRRCPKKKKKNINLCRGTKSVMLNMASESTFQSQVVTIDDLDEIQSFVTKEIENVQENLKKITPDMLKETYKNFSIHDFLSKYAHYDDVNVGVDGSSLSGGQKQRIYLAQNLFKQNKILILDEPTSSLDKVSENIINEALLKYMKGKTSIIFTHRLDLLNFVDYIGVLNDGSMVQFDLRARVLENPCDILREILSQSSF
ncbi:ATP-binding cassette, subfamily B (MDR/TAP), member 10 [Plasmodium inui San Antonio 1]|uniref:ATP-binding cassette, subfamily B (MDR/TAP), member 10 n=1 Tax=Plasmodium inui San Antonio 1 TaxID=1237626 RepID=W7A071_9APIC|nr:ATP-binding cassette, subfamily B (MDR/TAP), member 10 [Plasmodium inui San Antonio 1]EUD66537.1 ATP-binding cassette, subfamily B (MDR/TAP), member 10 [Plasmodium inui San Antonio 1]